MSHRSRPLLPRRVIAALAAALSAVIAAVLLAAGPARAQIGAVPAFTADTPPLAVYQAGLTAASRNEQGDESQSPGFDYQFMASGSPAPTFSISGGALPAGVTLDPNTGFLNGAPTNPGPFSFSVSASNGGGTAVAGPFTGTTYADSDTDAFYSCTPGGYIANPGGSVVETASTDETDTGTTVIQNFGPETYDTRDDRSCHFWIDPGQEDINTNLGDPCPGSQSTTHPGLCTLSVAETGAGAGTVTSADGDINCPGVCSYQYQSFNPVTVTLTATPAPGSTFTGWTGCASSDGATCTVTLDDDSATVTANFGLPAPVTTTPSPPAATPSPPATTPAPAPAPTPAPAGTPAAPHNVAAPSVSGTLKSGRRLTCSTGSWSGAPTGYAYAWSRNGTPLAGATHATYTVVSLDEGNRLACTVTASGAGGSASATTKAVTVPVPTVKGCPAATGALKGSTLGHLKLGMTRAQARRAYRTSTDKGLAYKDYFCLTPQGIRVGYAPPKVLAAVSAKERRAVSGRIVWASSWNPYYSLAGVRPGATLTAARRALPHGHLFTVGSNEWYLVRHGDVTVTVRVVKSIVKEIGVADLSLTGSLAADKRLMSNFNDD